MFTTDQALGQRQLFLLPLLGFLIEQDQSDSVGRDPGYERWLKTTLKESGHWLENVDWTQLALACGKLILQKKKITGCDSRI